MMFIIFSPIITVNIHINADNLFVVSCDETIICEGDMEYCKGKIRQMISELDQLIAGKDDSDIKKKVVFNLDVAKPASKDIAQKNRMDFKGFLDMLKSMSKCEIDINSGFHSFG